MKEKAQEKAKVSIVVPVYNVEDYLECCILSLVNQTLKETEIILVDDGSTDHSGEICDLWAAKDSRIHVIHQKNGGISSARNAGLRTASADFVGFVDSDDWISPVMYQRLYREAIETGSDVAVCRYQEVFHAEEVQNIPRESQRQVLNIEDTLKTLFLREISESVWDKLFKRSLWSNLQFPEGEINEDTVTLCTVFLKAHKTVFINDALYFYRKRTGSITNSGYSEKFRIVDKHLNKIQALVDADFPSVHIYMDYFFSVHYYCLLLSIIKDPNRNCYTEDYRKYLVSFKKRFRPFIRWGTGHQKDRLLALCLRFHCGWLIKILAGK